MRSVKDSPMPIDDFEKVAHDGPTPRSVQSDLDWIDAQSNRIEYLNKRVAHLEKALHFAEYRLLTLQEYHEYYSRKIEEAFGEEKCRHIVSQ